MGRTTKLRTDCLQCFYRFGEDDLVGTCPGHIRQVGMSRSDKDAVVKENQRARMIKQVRAMLVREALVEAKKVKKAEEQALKASEKEFWDSTISAKEAKKKLGLTDEELVEIGSIARDYAGDRYGRVDVFKYASLKKKPQKQGKLL